MSSTNPDKDPRALWIAMTQALLLGVVAGLAGYALLTIVLDSPARAQSVGTQLPPPSALL